MVTVPTVTFNNGHIYPILGLGTWKSKPGEVTAAVEYAIDLGYRHFDCAYIYRNEKEVGRAIAAKIAEGAVGREDLYVTSKLWNTFHRPELVEAAFEQSLRNLGLSYLDLYLMHWPFGFREGAELLPVDSSSKVVGSDVDYLETWAAMEGLLRKGYVKSIGVCNFNRRQIERLMSVATISPVVNQIECHPYLTQKKLMDFCRSRGILITAYSPLGSPDRPWAKPEDPQLLDDVKLRQIASKYGKTPAQIVLRYQVQRGNITIPKSVTMGRIEENIRIFDFELTPEDMRYIDSFDCNGRVCRFESVMDHRYYPFHDDY